MAREFGPKGVHVAHAIIDGVIDIPRTRGYVFKDEDAKIGPDAVSDLHFICRWIPIFSRLCDANLKDRSPMRIGICTRSRELLSRMRLILGHMLRNGDGRLLFGVGEIFIRLEIRREKEIQEEYQSIIASPNS